MRALSAILISSLLLGSAAAAETPPSGKTMCLQAAKIDHTQAQSDDALLIYMNDGKIWRNTLKATCQGLKFENGIKWDIRGATVCANMQSFRVLNSNNICYLGDFAPYTPPPKSP